MRVVNRVLSLLLGIILLGGGLLLVVEAVLAAAGQDSWLLPADDWYQFFTETTLGDQVVLIVALAVALLGLILLIAELRPWPPTRLPVHLETADGRWWITRRAAERRLAGAAETVSGAAGARARLRTRRDRWKVGVRVEAREDAQQEVEQAVQHTLARLGSPPDSSLQVRLVTPRRVS